MSCDSISSLTPIGVNSASTSPTLIKRFACILLYPCRSRQ
jgi:hypothetical protein